MRITPAAMLLFILPLLLAAYNVSGPDLKDTSGTTKRLVGVNMPYALFLKESDIDSALRELKKAEISVVRVFASFQGNKSYAFQTGPGKYNESMFKKLDYLISEADRDGISVLVTLMDNGSAYGGKEEYNIWMDGSNPDVFFKDRISREYYKKYIKKFLNRKNTVSGKTYKSDPAIFGWDLCSDAETPSDDSGELLYDWAEEMAGYIKKYDKKHLVVIGTKKVDIRENGDINNYDLFLSPSIDIVFYNAGISSEGSASRMIKYMSLYNKAFYRNVNKPIAVNFSDYTKSAPSRIVDTVKAFVSSNGSVIIFNYAGFGAYSRYKGAYNFDDPAVKSGFKKASEYASSVMDKAPQVWIEDIDVSTHPKTVKISFSLSERSSVRVVYGKTEPLKEQTKPFKTGGTRGSIELSGLHPDTEYSFMIKASSGDKAGISNVRTFKTAKVKRIKALPFKRSDNFIRAYGPAFYDGKREYRYLGTSNYYLRHAEGGKKKIDYILNEASKVGFKVLRINSHGEAVDMDSVDKQGLNRFFRIGPENFNEDAYRDLDYCLDSAARHGMRLILHFTDNWEYYGGVAVYAKWAGVSKNDFWTNEKCKEYYRQTVEKLVLRKNTVNGKIYKDDPTIFAYDLLNEPRNEADPTGKDLTKWIDEMSTYIKTLDPNHMVTTGMEGFHFKEDGTHFSGSDFIMCQKPKNIDFATFHVYPASEWNHFSMSTTDWLLKKWVKDAHEVLNKPVVMEEYGITIGLEEYPRDEWIDFMTRRFYELGGNGANYWFFIDPDYAYGDVNRVTPNDTELINIFTKYANKLNKNGY